MPGEPKYRWTDAVTRIDDEKNRTNKDEYIFTRLMTTIDTETYFYLSQSNHNRMNAEISKSQFIVIFR